MNWSQGYSAKYYMEIVDAESWRGVQRLEIFGGKINRTATGLRESADIDCREKLGEKYIRVWMDAVQNGGKAHVALFTGMTSQPTTKWDGFLPDRGLTCYSVLKAADDVDLQHGWYAPAEANAGTVIRTLLKTTPAPVVIVGTTPDLEQSIIAEDDETCVTMVDKILLAIGWRMRILGDGTIEIRPKATDTVRGFSIKDNDSIEPKIDVTDDWFKCPNVFKATSDGLVAIARDDSPNSFLSTVNRGREIWRSESNCDLNRNESIGEYAFRRLREEQGRAFTVEYSRRYDPDILVGEIVNLNYPSHDVVGNFKVVSQNIQLGHNATTSEEVCMV